MTYTLNCHITITIKNQAYILKSNHKESLAFPLAKPVRSWILNSWIKMALVGTYNGTAMS